MIVTRPLLELLLWAISSALTVVAAVDYRVRAEGSDLEAELDGAAYASVSVSPTAISPGVTTSQ
jgi:hypothetical protein